MKILVVDDEREIPTLLGQYLSSSGHSVTSARTELCALAWLDREGFDLVVIDVKTRRQIKGWALCRVLKSDPRTSRTRVVIISGVPSMQAKATAAGADAFLVKPFNLYEIELCVERLGQLTRVSRPAVSGLTVSDAIKAYSMGMLGWARGSI